MAEVTQYSLSHNELVELIIQKHGIHEGKWTLMLEMQIATGNFGPSPDQMFPGSMMAIRQTGIQRMAEGMPVPPGAIVVDAAKVNPAPKKRGK